MPYCGDHGDGGAVPLSLRGSIEAFPLEIVLQLLAATRKRGVLDVRSDGGEHGAVGMMDGRPSSARYGDTEGPLAFGALLAIDGGEFEFTTGGDVGDDGLGPDIESALERGRAERAGVAEVREVVPSERVRFRLSERAAERGEIVLTPAQWRALLLVDGERDVAEIAARLPMPRLETQRLLADLVRAGMADTIRPLAPDAEPSHAAAGGATLRGSLRDFPLETIVQLLAETGKTGRLEMSGAAEQTTLGLAEGRLVSAAWGDERGELALGGAFTAREGEFEFVPSADAPDADLAGGLDELLDRAAEVRDRIVAIREVIPDERSRFALSERATERSEIVLTPAQWRVLLGVDGQRDVAAIAQHLRMRRIGALMAIADLVRGGYVDVLVPAAAPIETERPVVPIETEPEAATELPSPPVPPAAEPSWQTAVEEPRPEPEPLPEPEPEVDERLGWLPAAPEEETTEAAAAEATAEAFIDPRLAAFAMPQPEAPAAVEPEPEPEAPPTLAPEPTFVPPPWEPPRAAPAAPPPKKGLFGGLFGGAPAAPAESGAATRAGQLAVLANELLDAYNSGRYGKGHVDDRIVGILMRADEQADPVDRPMPIANDRLDVASIDRGAVAERQALPYLAVLVRQIHEDAERALGKDKARRAFRDVRDRVLGRDAPVLAAPEVSAQLPKV